MTRTRRLLAALAVVALLGVGCSTTPGDTDAAGTNAEQHAQSAKFAQCMRDHGVKDFPDPDPSGELTIDAIANGSSVDVNTPAFEQALNGCKDLQPPGFTGDARTAQQQEAALEFAQCVRDHGVGDFPDPTPDGPLIDTNRIPSAARSGGMSILDAALAQCSDHAAAAGVTGP